MRSVLRSLLGSVISLFRATVRILPDRVANQIAAGEVIGLQLTLVVNFAKPILEIRRVVLTI